MFTKTLYNNSVVDQQLRYDLQRCFLVPDVKVLQRREEETYDSVALYFISQF